MYHRISMVSAITAIVASALMFGFMIMLVLMPIHLEEFGLGAIVVLLVVIGAYALIFISALPFAIVSLVFGVRMLKQQSRQKLISHNISVLVTSCVLLPFLAIGVYVGVGVILGATLELIPLIYTIVLGCAYVTNLIASIVCLIFLKRSPEETPPPAQEQA